LAYQRYIWLPAGLLLALLLVIELTGLDLILADFIYQHTGPGWWRGFWPDQVWHTGARRVSVALLLIILLTAVASCFIDRLKGCRRALFYTVISSGLAALTVASGKALSSQACPSDLLRYGGDLSYLPLLSMDTRDAGNCFPAGHASAGYGWFSLYFAGLALKSRWRIFGVLMPMAAGAVFGIVQQFRGEHFLSHDLWTMLICWTVAALTAQLMLKGPDESGLQVTLASPRCRRQIP